MMTRMINIPLRIIRLLLFVLFYFKEMLVSSLLLARDILTPAKTFKHGIIAIDLDLQSSTAIIALMNLISMTPGSLSIELTSDRKRMYIHAMYLNDPERFRTDIKNNFEKKIKLIFE